MFATRPLHPHVLGAALALAACTLLAPLPARAAAVLPLSSLDGGLGFRLDSAPLGDQTGHTVANLGDINSDGIDDLIISALFQVDYQPPVPEPNAAAKSAGSAGSASVDLLAPNAVRLEAEFEISWTSTGTSGEFPCTPSGGGTTGWSALGALEGNGSRTLTAPAIGSAQTFALSCATDETPVADSRLVTFTNTSYRHYVVFGQTAPWTSPVDLNALDGSNGFVIESARLNTRAGFASSAGDINGDGLRDILLGQDIGLNAFVIYGRSNGFSAKLDPNDLDGSEGFVIEASSHTRSVSFAGDLNHDGVDDLVIGTPDGSRAYVLFGRAPPTAPFASPLLLSTLDGATGFRLDAPPGEEAGYAVSRAGDLNDDGIDDLTIGAPFANGGSGVAYVVFGRDSTAGDPTPFEATLSLTDLDGSDGFALTATGVQLLGADASAAGDLNADGIDDLVVGAVGAPANDAGSPGRAYVLFGNGAPGAFAAALDVATLDGSNGFRIDGLAGQDWTGTSVAAAGDVNGDGLDDLIIGAPQADPSGLNLAGSSFLVFGRASGFSAVLGLASLDGSNGLRLDGYTAGERSGWSVSRAGDLNDDGIEDVVIGSPVSGVLGVAGRAHVVFGNGAPLLAMGADGTITSLEDDSGPVGKTIAELFPNTVYLDPQTLAGAAIDTDAPTLSDGVWQYRANAIAAWTAVPTGGLSPSNALLLAPDASLRFLPDSDAFGSAAALSLRAWDGADASAYSFGPGQDIRASIGSLGGFSTDANRLSVPAEVLPVNDAPSFTAAKPPLVDEDAGAQTVNAWAGNLSAGPANEAGQQLSFQVSSITNPGLFSVLPSVSSTGVLSYTLAADANGASGFLVRVVDDGGTANGGVDASANQFFVLSVRAINDAPSFSASDPPASEANAGPQTVSGWASGFVPGPADEAGQAVAAYLVSAIGNPGLFSVAPSVDTSGTLTYTAAPGASGSSTFSVQVRDNGGTASGGVDTSTSQVFTITVSTPEDDRIFCSGFEEQPCP